MAVLPLSLSAKASCMRLPVSHQPGLHAGGCREKESGGALDIPGGNRLIELEYAQVEDRKLRGQLRNVSKLELLVRPRQPWPRPCWR
jgi:hypothetical protein